MKAFVLTCTLLLSAAFAQAQSANLKTVMDNYARFGQGDIPGIIATLADNVSWTHPGNREVVAFAGTYDGQAGVGQFFEKVGASVKITLFTPSDFREDGNTVSNKVHLEGVVLATGKTYASDAVFTWNFNDAGQVTRWEATGDMSGLEAAYAK